MSRPIPAIGVTVAVTMILAACGDPAAPSADGSAALDPAPETLPAPPPPAPAVMATAVLRDAAGAEVGRAAAAAAAGGVTITLAVSGLEPGARGAHVHMTGSCAPPDFESAGDHWNPAAARHGLENPQGPHAGDMPNLVIGDDGTGSLEYELAGASLDSMLDADGAAIVVHADADDQITDPAGNSGDRVACGVFAAG